MCIRDRLRTYYRDRLRGYRLGAKAKAALLDGWPERFSPYLTGDTDTNRLKSEVNRRLRLHRLAETYVTMDNAGIGLFQDEKPKVFSPQGYHGEAIEYPAFYSSREVKEMGIDTTQVRSSRFAGVLLAPTGIFVTYNSSAALMKWRCKSEMRVKALMWSVLCQQRLASQYRAEDVHGLVLGESMELAYQLLTSTGGAKHDYFMLDGSYDHFYFRTNNHQGEVILALLCDPLKLSLIHILCQPALRHRQYRRLRVRAYRHVHCGVLSHGRNCGPGGDGPVVLRKRLLVQDVYKRQTVYPGEWVCTLKELSQWFRTRFQCQALAVLERLQRCV